MTYRVLIADDADETRLLLRTLLAPSRAFEVVAEAATGRAAVDMAIEHRPDLALLDLSMPELDGLEALPLIREAVPGCTVVVLSGFEADRMADKAMAAGAAAYLTKGISPTEIVGSLLRILTGEAPGAAGEGAGDDGSDEVAAVELRLPSEISSPRVARRFVTEKLSEWGLDHLADDAALLTTELVTNAVVHAHSWAILRVGRSRSLVHIEVVDGGAGALVMRQPDLESGGGRGLGLVAALSSTWGTLRDDRGKVVWFDLKA